MSLRIENIPEKITPLLTYAEAWGIGDDYQRERKVADASDSELIDLVHCIDSIDKQALFEWLEGAESYQANPSNEYLAFTCLTMAIESAKIKIKDRGIRT